MATRTTTPQEIQFTLMRLSSFNNFDGNVVADSLVEHEDLWTAFIMDRADYYYNRSDPESQKRHQEPVDLIRLRDIAAGYWNVDTLYLLAAPGKETELELLAHREWGADEIDWMQNTHVGRYLRVWWD
jgi:hypothetical protein